jgi:methionine-S-sulfoxide reductase
MRYPMARLALIFVFLTASFSLSADELGKATFAGGCFWCMEPPFEDQAGVKEVVSGYMGGTKANPTYEEVSGGATGHAEVVTVVYDPKLISYETLLEIFWHNIDPTDAKGQFVDRGLQYRPAIFYYSDAQKKLAEESKKTLESSKIFGKPVAVAIDAAGPFYKAEDYHQDYYKKNPVRYKYYRYHSGRDEFLEKSWKNHRDYKIFKTK